MKEHWSNIENVYRSYVWEDIQVKNEDYTVNYKPIKMTSQNIAELNIKFSSELKEKEISQIMKTELNKYIKKYPVPTGVLALDKNEEDIEVDSLIGYLDENKLIIECGDYNELSSSKNINKISDEDLFKIYQGKINYKERSKIKEEDNKKMKEKIKINKFLKLIDLLFLVVVIAFEIFTQLQYVSTAILIIQVIRKILRYLGYESKRTKERKEIERKKNHYYYHCELNPKAFNDLKLNNIINDNK